MRNNTEDYCNLHHKILTVELRLAEEGGKALGRVTKDSGAVTRTQLRGHNYADTITRTELRGQNYADRIFVALGFPERGCEMEDARTFSESEDEAIQETIGRLDESVWYDLQPRVVPRTHATHRSGMEVAVDASDEPDFHLDPHPLLVGGHEPHAGRLDPKTIKCGTTRAEERSLWTGQNQTAGPRRVGENPYIVLKFV